jgi:hypothetical protein
MLKREYETQTPTLPRGASFQLAKDRTGKFKTYRHKPASLDAMTTENVRE